MKSFRILPFVLVALSPVLLPGVASAQATVADYQRSMGLREKYADLTSGTADAPRWIEQTNRFYYRRTVKGGHEWMLVDGTTQAKTPAFDHEKLAAAISTAASRKATAVSLPFTNFTFVDNGRAIEFALDRPRCRRRRWGLAAAVPRPRQDVGAGQRTCRPGAARSTTTPAVSSSRAPDAAAQAEAAVAAVAGWPDPVRPEFDINANDPRPSPDGKLEALVRNYNLADREVGSGAS